MTLKRTQQVENEVFDSVEKTLNKSIVFLQTDAVNLNICDYVYDPIEAIEELGLDSVLINQLLEDYVGQILRSKIHFLKHLKNIRQDVEQSKKINFTPLRELAHKNLGVARNLRIKDGIIILDILMKKDDLDSIALCIEALEATAVRLKPKYAHETIKLIDLKSSLIN
nr:hypothetical protein [uncultured Sulfurimonas sp.]